VASERVRNTAYSVALLRALEQHSPPGERLVDDPLSERLLTGVRGLIARTALGRRAFARLLDSSAPGFFGGIACRTKAFDDACVEALGAGVAQVVIAGAGMDTRPYLPPSTSEEFFAYAGTLAPGSRLVFSYLQRDVLESELYAKRARQFSWQTGFAPERLAALLAAQGLHLVRDLAAEDFRTLYLRPRGRDLPVFDLERTAVAQVP